MRKSGFIKVAIAPLLGVLLLSGCAERTAQDVVKEGLSNLLQLQASSYDVALKGDITDPTQVNVKFDLKFNGQVDTTNADEAKLTMNFDGSASNSASAFGSAKGDVKISADTLYFNVADLTMDGEGAAIPQEVSLLFGKWWKYTLPAGYLQNYGISFAPVSDADKEKMQENLNKVLAFITAEKVGSDSIMGEDSNHYKINVDKKGLVDFLKNSAEEQGSVVSDEEVAQMLDQFNKMDFIVDIWIGNNNNVVNKFVGDFAMNGTAANSGMGSLSINVTLGDFGKALTIEEPEGTAEFPFAAFLGGASTGSDVMMDDPTLMMDEAGL